MVVALIIKNETFANEIDKLQKIGEESKPEKSFVKLPKEKNRKLKHQLIEN